jgi:putative PIN family toxin of toxin-antitoxin system
MKAAGKLMYKVVIDTNVFISSRLSLLGNPAKVMKLIVEKNMELYYSLSILNEYKRVLVYERLKFSIEHQMSAIEDIKNIGILLEPEASVISLPDESDRVFYDTARTVNAYLITGNLKHYPEEPQIVTPALFVEILGKSGSC